MCVVNEKEKFFGFMHWNTIWGAFFLVKSCQQKKSTNEINEKCKMSWFFISFFLSTNEKLSKHNNDNNKMKWEIVQFQKFYIHFSWKLKIFK